MRILLVATVVSSALISTGALAQAAPTPDVTVSNAPKIVAPPERRPDISMKGVCEAWKIRAAEPGKDCKDYGDSQRFVIGQVIKERVAYTAFPQIPAAVRSALNLHSDGRYIYDRNYLYAVDPQTHAVTDVVKVETR